LSLTLPVATQTRLTVEAVDGEAQRASTHLTFAVAADAPQPCNAVMPCAAGTCESGSCVAAPDAAAPADAASALDAGVHVSPAHGCSFGDDAPASGALAFFVLLVAIARAIRSRC
jgi:hypothetical protein